MGERSNKEYRTWEPLLIGIAAAIGLLAGYNIDLKDRDASWLNITDSGDKVQAYKSDGRIEEILRFVESNYVDSLDMDGVTLSIIDKLLVDLDPHSSYITPEAYNDHREKMSGYYTGIGVETLLYNDSLYISMVNEDGPAYHAGVRLGDLVLKINAELVSGQGRSQKEVRQLMKDNDSDVVIMQLRPLGVSNISTIEVPKEKINLNSADLGYKVDKGILYLKVSRFSENTYEQFVESVDAHLGSDQSTNLILDLRGNPGGPLNQAVKILSQLFNEKDKLLTYTEGLNRKKAEYRTTGKNFFNIKKVAVLMDGFSASASEIIAGAIQDWDRGIIIGEQSYGKGLVQEIFPMNNKGALRLTVAKYYTPSGRSIQKAYDHSISNTDDTQSPGSKLLGRRLSSGVGIMPDILLSSERNPECGISAIYLDQYLIDVMKQIGTSELDRSDLSFSSFVESMRAAYNGTDLEQELLGIESETAETCRRQLVSDTYLRYKRMVLSEIDYTRYNNLNDPLMKAALTFINDQRETTALLSQEN